MGNGGGRVEGWKGGMVESNYLVFVYKLEKNFTIALPGFAVNLKEFG
jgi:hypothetical protein